MSSPAKTRLDAHLETLGPVDGAQTAIDTAIPVISARNAAQAASGVKVVGQGALKKFPLVNLPFLAGEAANNTAQGWGNAIVEQDKAIGDSFEVALIEGLANPLTTIASAGVKAPGAAVAVKDLVTAKSDATLQKEAQAHHAAHLKSQAAKAAGQSMAQRLLQQSLFRSTADLSDAAPAMRPAPAGGDLSGM